LIDVLKDGTEAAEHRLEKLLSRDESSERVAADVTAIIKAVRRGGDAALLRYTKRFDGVSLEPRELLVPTSDFVDAARRVPADVQRALRVAHERIVRFHKHQIQTGFEVREDGMRLGMRVTPLEKAGVYVPGGTAAYPSSVLMNVVPARVAGVADITVVTPPSVDGIRPEVLLAAQIAGADRVVRAGGAQAVAALAYGTETVSRVDKIVGPGNIWVATAKRLVFGAVDIDMIAGPSEVLIIADATADPCFVAADMLAQAEHDPLAAAVCITTDAGVAREVAIEVERQLVGLSRRSIAGQSIRRFGTILLVGSTARAVDIANRIAPEHLELFIEKPRKLLPDIRNAGAVFLGQYSTEPLGDYAAGPNHVLPTGGAARFSSPLGVHDFIKRTSIIEASRWGLEKLAPTVECLANCEGLEGHALAVRRRLERSPRKTG
jgi:histidinol dehydrogenase